MRLVVRSHASAALLSVVFLLVQPCSIVRSFFAAFSLLLESVHLPRLARRVLVNGGRRRLASLHLFALILLRRAPRRLTSLARGAPLASLAPRHPRATPRRQRRHAAEAREALLEAEDARRGRAGGAAGGEARRVAGCVVGIFEREQDVEGDGGVDGGGGGVPRVESGWWGGGHRERVHGG